MCGFGSNFDKVRYSESLLCYGEGFLLYRVVNLVLYYVLLGIYIRGKGTPGMFDLVL
jgi:hypothetical protein